MHKPLSLSSLLSVKMCTFELIVFEVYLFFHWDNIKEFSLKQVAENAMI